MLRNVLLVVIFPVLFAGCWWNKDTTEPVGPVDVIETPVRGGPIITQNEVGEVPAKVDQDPTEEEIQIIEVIELDPKIKTTPRSEIETQVEIPIEETQEEVNVIRIIPIEDVPTFEEVLDEGDADEMLKPATKEEILANETVEDKASRVKVRRIADKSYREKMGASEVGLDYRAFDRETFDEVYGVRPILLYFTQKNCAECEAWDELLKNNADKLAAVNALVLKADFDSDAQFRDEYRVDGIGSALFFSTMGVVMGQKKNPDIDSIVKFFGRFK